MTEERLEQLVEGAAGRFDRSMNRAWEHRPVRLVAAAGLLLGYGAYFLWVLQADPIMDWRFSVTGGATLSPPPGGPAGRCTGGSGGC